MSLPAENVHTIPQPVATVAMTPMAMLDRAVSSGAGIEMIEKLMGLQERWETNQARKSFDAAIAAAKAEIPVIAKNATGHNSKKYANFAAIAGTIDPIISKHGLSYRFRTTQGERISVTCILSHRDGHSEETTLSGPADNSGNKNAIQSIGSTLTYLQRYSLVQMLGLAASEDDDAHMAGSGEAISEAQVEELIALADDVGADKAKFCKYFKVDSFPAIPASRFKSAVDALNAKRRA
jgi:hypothetical protein